MRFSSAAHYLDGARFSARTGALLHFKFIGQFSDHVATAVKRKSYADGAREYQRYQELLTRGPVNFVWDKTLIYEGAEQLDRLGLLAWPN